MENILSFSFEISEIINEQNLEIINALKKKN